MSLKDFNDFSKNFLASNPSVDMPMIVPNLVAAISDRQDFVQIVMSIHFTEHNVIFAKLRVFCKMSYFHRLSALQNGGHRLAEPDNDAIFSVLQAFGGKAGFFSSKKFSVSSKVEK